MELDDYAEAGPEDKIPELESLHEENRVLAFLAEALHWFEVGLAALSVVFVALGVVFLLEKLLYLG